MSIFNFSLSDGRFSLWCIELGFLMLSKGEQKSEGSQRQEARVLGCLFTSENLPVPKYMT